MIRSTLSRALVVGMLTMSQVALAGAIPIAAGQAGGQATAADAAPFLGEWALALQGPNGPGAFALAVTVEKEKVGGEISSDQLPKQVITDVTKADKALILNFSFTWEGSAVPAAVSLTPAGDGRVTAQIDFAGGAYVMTGTATRKEKTK